MEKNIVNTGIGELNSLANYACLRYSLVPIRNFRVYTTSGYIQRRIVKLTEDIKIQYDGTVRDCVNSIYQLSYGENGLDPTKTIKVGKQQECCDISSIVNKLNIKHEDSLKEKTLKKKIIKPKTNSKDLNEIFENFGKMEI